jgi:hypothetical protein
LAIARTAFAMDPCVFGVRTLMPDQRAREISDRAKKFSELISEINSKVQNRIQILRPATTHGDLYGHAVELKLHGVTRKKLCKLAESYGVFIADSYVSANDQESVRIAFHPYMNNDAIKIISCVLLKACEPESDE